MDKTDITKENAENDKEELEEKRDELKEFVESPEFRNVSEAQQSLLKRQLEVTNELIGVLEQRAKTAPEEDDDEKSDEDKDE